MAKKEHTPEQKSRIDLVMRHLQPGDIITHTRCMGMLEEHKFIKREGYWLHGRPTADTKHIEREYKRRGHGTRFDADDISPLSVTHINRIPVDVIDCLAVNQPK